MSDNKIKKTNSQKSSDDKNKITFEEFRKIAFEELRDLLSPFPKEEVEEYIKSLEDDIKSFYEEELLLTEYLGTNHINPSGYAYGRMMMF